MVTHNEISANYLAAGIVFVVLAAAVFLMLPGALRKTVNLSLGDGIFKAEVALNQSDRNGIVSSASSLENSKALLLAYPDDGDCIVDLSKVSVPVDVVSLDSYKRVERVVRNVNDYYVSKNCKYMVILSAGSIVSKAINIRETAVFEIDGSKVE